MSDLVHAGRRLDAVQVVPAETGVCVRDAARQETACRCRPPPVCLADTRRQGQKAAHTRRRPHSFQVQRVQAALHLQVRNQTQLQPSVILTLK